MNAHERPGCAVGFLVVGLLVLVVNSGSSVLRWGFTIVGLVLARRR